VFDSPDDHFDENSHKVNINLAKGTLLRDTEKRVPVEKINISSPQPRIVEIKDIFSGKRNELLTSNGAVIIRGHNIKLTGDDPSCGLWFVGNNTEIKAEIISENKPSTLIAVIPTLEKGQYQLKVVTQYSSSKMLKTTKICVYPVVLTVL
jgi:hypothetical protein